jgi:hypothetical protein
MVALLSTKLEQIAPIESGAVMEQNRTGSGGRCLLGVIIDADMPVTSKVQKNRKKADRFWPTGAA